MDIVPSLRACYDKYGKFNVQKFLAYKKKREMKLFRHCSQI